MASRVVIYTTPWCGYCVRAKGLLNKHKIAFDEIDVDGDPPARARLTAATGSRTVPQIFIDGSPIGGCDELHALDRAGELARLLKTG